MFQVFRDLPFRWKTALPLIFLAVLLLLVGAVGMYGIHQGLESSTRLTNRYLPAVSLLLNADRDLYQAMVAERSLLAEGGQQRRQALLAYHAENLQQASDRVRSYAASGISNEALGLVREFDQLVRAWATESAEVLRLSESDPLQASQLSFEKSEPAFERARDIIDRLGELEDEAAQTEGGLAIERGQFNQFLQGLLVAIGLTACVVLVLFFPVLVTRPMHRLLDRLHQLSEGDGDLRVRLEVDSRDELGQLGGAFNQFLDKLQPLIAEVRRVTEEVAEAAHHLADTAASNDRLISEQHSSVDQVTTAATEMSAAIQEVARNAQNTADAARHTEVQSREGAAVVRATIGSIGELARDVEETADTMRALEQETSNIGAVLEVIRGIAEQTNLLALNAAIEAARAGEQGRGFAVVADEVRALAARTQESTKDIQQRIERLQGGVQQAVRATLSGSGKAHESVERAAGADQALSVAGESVQRINDMAAQIATACEEQSSATEEIARNISDINDLSHQAARLAEQGAQASRRLSELSRTLAQLVGRFSV